MRADGETWIQYTLAIAAGAYAFNSIGHTIAAFVPNQASAMVFAGAVFSASNIFSGLYIPRPHIPAGWIWYVHVQLLLIYYVASVPCAF